MGRLALLTAAFIATSSVASAQTALGVYALNYKVDAISLPSNDEVKVQISAQKGSNRILGDKYTVRVNLIEHGAIYQALLHAQNFAANVSLAVTGESVDELSIGRETQAGPRSETYSLDLLQYTVEGLTISAKQATVYLKASEYSNNVGGRETWGTISLERYPKEFRILFQAFKNARTVPLISISGETIDEVSTRRQ